MALLHESEGVGHCTSERSRRVAPLGGPSATLSTDYSKLEIRQFFEGLMIARRYELWQAVGAPAIPERIRA